MASPRNSLDTGSVIVVPRRDHSIDFANTLGWRGSVPAESLHNWREVLDWLVAAKAMPERAVGALSKAFIADEAEAAKVFDQMIALRETIYRLLHAAVDGAAPAGEDLRGLNQALGEAPPRVKLVHAGEGFGWRIELRADAASILAPVLWPAA